MIHRIWHNWPLSLCCIAVLTLYLFQSPIAWFWQQILIDPFSGLLLFMLPVIWYFRPHTVLHFKPLTFSLYPTILFWLFVTAYLINENYVGVHIFSAVFFLGTIYSLLGLVLSEQQWRALFFPFSLLVLVLPFEGYLDIYAGFPLRLLSAEWAGQVLQVLGFTSMSHESIILIEEKAANVDLACSGIKGIWTGAIFFLLLSIIEGHRITGYWLAVGACFIACLLVANVLRIVLLVLLGVVAELSHLADMVHLTMGLLGFSISCIVAWALLRLPRSHLSRKSNKSTPDSENPGAERITRPPSVTASLIFIAGLFLCLWFYQPYHPVNTAPAVKFHLPADLNPQNLILSELENTFFSSNHASVNKLRFNFEGYSGSLLVVKSQYWKAQHEPQNCYIGQGYSTGFEGTWLLPDNTAVRFIKIDNNTKTAVYWFQSLNQITPDYSARVIDGVLHPENAWLMISVLIDQPVEQRHIDKLLLKIQTSFSEQLTTGVKNG